MHCLRPPAYRLYVYLRMRMDDATGVVGRKHGRAAGLSLLLLCNLMGVGAAPGVAAYKPDKSAVRRMLGTLEREGLIVRIPPKDFFVFRLPYALQDQSVQKQADTGSTQRPTQVRHTGRHTLDGEECPPDAGLQGGDDARPTHPNTLGRHTQTAQADTTLGIGRLVDRLHACAREGGLDHCDFDAVNMAFEATGVAPHLVASPQGRQAAMNLASMQLTPEQLGEVMGAYTDQRQRKAAAGENPPLPQYAVPIGLRVKEGGAASYQGESAMQYVKRTQAERLAQ